MAAHIVRGRRVRGRRWTLPLLLRFDAFGVGVLGAQLVPVLSLGGQGGGGRGMGCQQVKGARCYRSYRGRS